MTPEAVASMSAIGIRNVAEVRRWSDDLVQAVEKVRLDVFRTGVALVALVTMLSAALLPTREGVVGAHVALA
jgi:hypothetical protein